MTLYADPVSSVSSMSELNNSDRRVFRSHLRSLFDDSKTYVFLRGGQIKLTDHAQTKAWVDRILLPQRPSRPLAYGNVPWSKKGLLAELETRLCGMLMPEANARGMARLHAACRHPWMHLRQARQG
jgi:hypothetical protein